MIIGIDTRFLFHSSEEAVTPVTREVLQVLASEHPETQFYFFSDGEGSAGSGFPTNVTGVTLPLRRGLRLGRPNWLDVALPKALVQYRVDVFLSPGGVASLRTTVPQLVVWKENPASSGAHNRLTGFLSGQRQKQYIEKAHTLLVASWHEKEILKARWQRPDHKVHVIGTTISSAFQPADAAARDAVKTTYTGGREYFVGLEQAADTGQLVTLLKAFSIFKKRQRSSWKLLLPGAFAATDNAFGSLLQTYRYKEDVVLPGAIREGEWARILASSYAAVALGKEDPGPETLCALKCGIPCLVPPHNGTPGNPQGGCLAIDTTEPAQVAEALMLLYKDELLHGRLVQDALLTASAYTPQHTASLVWQSLQQSVAGF